MHMKRTFKSLIVLAVGVLSMNAIMAQELQWAKDGNSYYELDQKQGIVQIAPQSPSVVVMSKTQLTPANQKNVLDVASFSFSEDDQKILLFTDTRKVWRLNTKGNYWVYDKKAASLKQIGKGRPASSLMFAKFSPDGKKVAYVSEFNIYVEDLATGAIKKLTTDGSRKLINGTFDWVYEEEFFCRDGFRWSPDSRQIAFWQIDAKNTKDYLMINNTDSIYPVAVPVEYPIAGDAPSPFKIGVVDIASAKTSWMKVPNDKVLQSYVTRLEWAGNNELIMQHMNRRQNESNILLCDTRTGVSKSIYNEKDAAWIDVIQLWDEDYIWGGWDWINNGKEFIWPSEKDGWRHLYRVSRDGKETLITAGNYDVMDIVCIDEKGGYVYFMASPDNGTQKYLYRIAIDGKGTAERLSPASQQGMHSYDVSPNARYAVHGFSNYYTPGTSEMITLQDHKPVDGTSKIESNMAKADKSKSKLEFFKLKIAEGVEMDGWMVKPQNFDANKKYPVVFYVYTEPWGQNVKDQWGVGRNFLYAGDMTSDGYIYISIDNRGTPVPKGREWRKSLYRKIGQLNISDQAAAAREVLKWNFIDTSRVAVWGWSGGGSATLNLMFQYPDIYKTGISVAAISNLHTYDNIYEERYMGLPEENKQDYLAGSPLTYAKNLKGHLLYIHGTADDNVHYNNAEMLINELVKHNKQFQLMSYPNRTHSLAEGEGTFMHLATMYTNFLKQYCPPGAR
ncbi:dipeptidyl-peptidase-4 [Pseudobacter ginsenosidimutans]|uniref:Dipeptidyl-peptidase-4 n=2 Tax=Pseudobacter ginsenosidimutans TaxID=661488 RepID=A0A4V2EZP3_9BACT|nr:S9 family peptidase [Pseudobacter ginsenosidimutans]RZS67190.1 dipeptidyl-peptidase-4 [Pseudobacter ginsenosidimutans]